MMASSWLTLTLGVSLSLFLGTAAMFTDNFDEDGDSGTGPCHQYPNYDFGFHVDHVPGDRECKPAPAPGPGPGPAPQPQPKPQPVGKTQVLFLDLIITLDGSSATGPMAFGQIKQFIIMLLQTYKLGGNSLRINVVYSNGANIQVFTFDNDAQTQSYVSQIQACSYSGATLNILPIFQRILSFSLGFQRAGAGRCLFLMGGFFVGNSWEMKAKAALYVQVISFNFRFYYFAIGSQLSLDFWRDMMDSYYIIQPGSLDVTASWWSNWFQNRRPTFSIYGLWRNLRSVNLQLIMTLDGSSATGRDGYYKTIYMMLALLRSHTLGMGNLELFVCVHRGYQVDLVQFRSTGDVAANLNAFLTQYLSFSGVSSNVVLLLQKVEWTVKTYFALSQPRMIWLCGGLQVSNQQQVKLILYQLEVTQKVYIYYFAMGVQTDINFWMQMLGANYVKTAFPISLVSFNSMLVNMAAIASNQAGPTVTALISMMASGRNGNGNNGGNGGKITNGNVGNGGFVTSGNKGNGGFVTGGNRGFVTGGNGGNGGFVTAGGNRGNGGFVTGGNQGSGGFVTSGNQGNGGFITGGNGGFVTGGNGGNGGFVTAGGNRGNGGFVTGGNQGNGGFVTSGKGGNGMPINGNGGSSSTTTHRITSTSVIRNGGWSSGGSMRGGGSMRIVGGVTQVPQSLNMRGTGCAGMDGTKDVGGGYCAIINMNAFVAWARSVGFQVVTSNQNGMQTIRISGSFSG